VNVHKHYFFQYRVEIIPIYLLSAFNFRNWHVSCKEWVQHHNFCIGPSCQSLDFFTCIGHCNWCHSFLYCDTWGPLLTIRFKIIDPLLHEAGTSPDTSKVEVSDTTLLLSRCTQIILFVSSILSLIYLILPPCSMSWGFWAIWLCLLLFYRHTAFQIWHATRVKDLQMYTCYP
jgi:hypothetical protein